ncbi:CoA-binding protein [Chloroflexota bacterium]
MQNKIPDSKPSLDYLFQPRSIAIIGVSPDGTKLSAGREFLNSLIDIGFKGKLYPVRHGGGEVHGLKIYPNITDIPDSIDYVISAIPAQQNLQLVVDSASKGAKAMHIFSAGFSEIADVEGAKLESQLMDIARQKGVRIIGPNCMGLYCPKTGLAVSRELPKQSGAIGFISQSGGNTAYAIREGAMRGIYFSKAISYGNASDLNECDFLEYLTNDPDTTLITGYIEGVKEGTRFRETLKRATQKKPVILYKAGTTAGGVRAAASHTGSLAGSNEVWEVLLKQEGAIQVHSMEELVDMMLIFKHMSPPTGRNVALAGVGGGAIVQSADECVDEGLSIPTLPLEIRQKLDELYTSETGGSFRNPIDMNWAKGDLIRKTIELVTEYEQIDLFMMQILIGIVSNIETTRVEPFLEPYIESIIGLSEELRHRTAIVLRPVGMARFWPVALEIKARLIEADFPVYPSARRAANAIVKLIEYYQRQSARQQ